jgi:hypothetical protein
MIFRCFPRLAASLILASFLAGCSSPPEVNYDQRVEFKPPKTFTWLDDNPLKYSRTDYKVSPFLEAHLMEATRAELESKGYRYVSMAEGPDFAVAFTFGAREKIQKSSYPSSYSLASASPGAYSFRGPGAVQTTTYVEGQISIDFFAESTKSLAWQISDSGKIKDMSGEELRQEVKELMANLLSDFPPNG